MNNYDLISQVEIAEKLPVYIQELDHEIKMTINLIKIGDEVKAAANFKNNMEALANLIELINVLCQVGIFEENTKFFDFQDYLSCYLDNLIYAYDTGNLQEIAHILSSETKNIFNLILSIYSER